MKQLAFVIAILFATSTAAETVQVDPAIPAYAPVQTVSGKLVCWGDDAFEDQMKVWAKAFKAIHPDIDMSWFLKGTSTAVGALYTGTAQLGVFGREIRPLEIVSWKRIFPYQPLGFSVATGGFNKYNGTNAVAIFVNKDNPLQHISLTQLDAIYSRDRKRGGKEAITTWGQLGLTGEWADKPITVYGLDEATGTAQFFQFRVLQEGRWSYDIKLPKGAPNKMYAGSGNDASQALVKVLSAERYAIGLATFRNLDPGLKALTVGETDQGPFIEGTRDTVINRTYPLSRLVYMFVNKDPNKPWDPKVYEFLNFILSKEGQQGVVEAATYYPLPAKVIESERAKLK